MIKSKYCLTSPSLTKTKGKKSNTTRYNNTDQLGYEDLYLRTIQNRPPNEDKLRGII